MTDSEARFREVLEGHFGRRGRQAADLVLGTPPTLDDIVGWLEQQPGADEALGAISAGYPAEEVLRDYEVRSGRTRLPE